MDAPSPPSNQGQDRNDSAAAIASVAVALALLGTAGWWAFRASADPSAPSGPSGSAAATPSDQVRPPVTIPATTTGVRAMLPGAHMVGRETGSTSALGIVNLQIRLAQTGASARLPMTFTPDVRARFSDPATLRACVEAILELPRYPGVVLGSAGEPLADGGATQLVLVESLRTRVVQTAEDEWLVADAWCLPSQPR